MVTPILQKIWGISYEVIEVDGYTIWRAFIDKPFNSDGWKVGLNEKFLLEALKQGVHRFILVVGQREMEMNVPSAKELKRKDKESEFELKQSLFKGSPTMKIYRFNIN